MSVNLHLGYDERDRKRYWEGIKPLQTEVNALFRASTLLPYIAMAPREEQDAVFADQVAKARAALDQLEILHRRAQEYREAFVPQFPLVPLAFMGVRCMTANPPPRDDATEIHPHLIVSVDTSGNLIARIETECLSGRELSLADEDAIRTAAHHLPAFLGDPSPASLATPAPAAQDDAERVAEAATVLLSDNEACLRFAEGFDREDAAQMGEPSPHSFGGEDYAAFAADRISCVKAGLRALGGRA